MDFHPREFSPEARDRVDREKIRAYRELLPNSAYDYNDQKLAIRCIMRIFLAFAREACALRSGSGWTIESVERESEEILRRVTIMVVFDKFPGLDRHWINNWNGSINSDGKRRLKESVEWKEYEELLLTTPVSSENESKSAKGQLREKPQPTDQSLRNAIHEKKARIVEIESTLDRLQEEVSRLQLEEHRDHLVAELEELKSELRGVLVDRAVASRRRMESSVMPAASPPANLPVLDAQRSRALLGVELSNLENLRCEVWRRFFEEAHLPRVVEVEWGAVLSSKRMPDPQLDLGLTFALMKEYVKAISRASAGLVELLMTAAIANVRQADLREAIWRECLDFACELGQWDAFTIWVDRVTHISWEVPVTVDGAPDREQLKRASVPRQDFFERRVGMYLQDWLSSIDRAVELRLAVSAPPKVKASEKTESHAIGKRDIGNTRRSVIKPILDKEGMSIHDWANKARVDFHTANNYLKGKTMPYPATLKKLAEALGLEVAKLPT
jgi:lambda repressor-like predicted transcriptional regulator